MLQTLVHKPLGELLIGRGFIEPAQLQRALETQRLGRHQKLLGEILVDLQQCSPEQITQSLAESYGLPFARITSRLADPKIASVLPRAFIEKHEVLPLFLVDGILTVAVAEPANVFLIEEIERQSGRPVQLVVATTRDIANAIRSCGPDGESFAIDELADAMPASAVSIQLPIREASLQSDSPESKLLNYCLFSAVNERASAVHFEPSAEFLRIRFRIDGALVEKLRLPAKLHTRFLAHLKSLCGLDASTPRPQEAHLNVQVDHKQFELILSVAPMIGGEKIVIRILDAEKASMRLEQLGFSYDMLKQWRRLLSLSSGLIVVTGPRDSGTQTTLYCSAAYKSSPGSNVCIVEPSVGRVVPGVNQFQAPAGVSVSSALEAVLKQDPDVLMLPELPDPATALLASRAAMNGQLVLAGLPAHDPISAIAHLGHLGIEPYVLSATLRGVLSQRLVRKLCHACREQHAPTQNEKRQLDKWAASFATLYRAKGCDRCHHRGHTGRVGVFELLLPTDLLLDRLGQSTSAADLRAVPRTASPTLLQDATEKLRAGVTTLDEILRIMA